MLFFILSLVLNLSSAQNTSIDSHLETKNPLKLRSALMTRDELAAGDRTPVTLKVELQKDHWAYEDKLKIRVKNPAELEISDIEIRPLIEFVDFAKQPHKGFTGETELFFFIEMPRALPKGLEQLEFILEYVACTTKFCLPLQQVDVGIPISVKKQKSESYIEKEIDTNWLWALLLIFGFGFLTSLTPCVYPLIPITLAVIGTRRANRVQSFFLSVTYVLGIATTYSILGVIAAKTGALFGQALSHPAVSIFFALLFLLMAFSLFGMFELRAPLFLTQKVAENQKTGHIGAFIAGLGAGVIASPCVGPVLVGILAYIAKSQNTFMGFLFLFVFALGMGLLFLAIGTFSSLAQKIPRSGPWTTRIKVFLGLLMLGLSFYYIKPLIPESFTFSDRSERTLPDGWSYYQEDIIADAKKKQKAVIIDFYADWCAACHELEKKTFSTKEFILASNGIVLLKVDATENFPGLSELQKTYDVYGLPTVVFIDKTGQIRKELSVTGYEKAEEFSQRIQKLNTP